MPGDRARVGPGEQPQLLALDVVAARRPARVDDERLHARARGGRVGAVAVVPVLPRDHVRVGEADDALDRLEVVGGAVLGQERHVAGLGRPGSSALAKTMSSSGSHDGPEPGPAEGAGQAVVVEGEAGARVAGVAVGGVGAEVEGDQRLVEDEGRRVDGADRVEDADVELGQRGRVEDRAAGRGRAALRAEGRARPGLVEQVVAHHERLAAELGRDPAPGVGVGVLQAAARRPRCWPRSCRRPAAGRR